MNETASRSTLDDRADLIVPPALPPGTPAVAFFDLWPSWLFYTPMTAVILYLALKHRSLTVVTAANPYFQNGGLAGESKSQVLSLLPASLAPFVPRWVAVRRNVDAESACQEALKCMQAAGIVFPAVAKPDVSCRGAGVRRVVNAQELRQYCAGFPLGERFLVQELCDLPMEASVFYARKPDEDHGAIVSLTLKYFPVVTGDGLRTLRELILDDPRAGRLAHLYLPRHAAQWNDVVPQDQIRRIAFAGNHTKGALLRNGHALVTTEMTEAYEAIAKQIPEFYFGRFDVRCESVDDLQQTRNIKILEINGVGAEAIHIWDPRTRLVDAYRDMARQWALAYEIGDDNKRRGHRQASLAGVLGAWLHEQALTRLYPATE